MKCYLCLGTELIVCSRLLSCFFPEPPSAQTVLVPNRKVTDVGPALWAGLYQGPDQLLYFHLCRLQGLHCKRLTDWSASRPHLTQLGSLSWKMFLFRHWCDFIETSPFKMQAHTWRWKADSHRYHGWVLHPVHFSIYWPRAPLGMQDAARTGTWYCQGTLLYSFLIIMGATLRQTAFLSLQKHRHEDVRNDDKNSAFQWGVSQPTCSTLSASHTQTISSYCKHQSETVQQNWI